jgi:DinB family protein
MKDLVITSITAQMTASLKMLQACIDKCPDGLWENEIIGKRAFWEVAYHIAFYADLYLTPHIDQYTGEPDWAWPNAAGLGHKMEPPFEPLDAEDFGLVLDRQRVSQYITDTIGKLHRVIPAETEQTLAGESGFFWYPINRVSMHLVNLRHIMHHTGQLSAALRRHDIPTEWVGTT